MVSDLPEDFLASLDDLEGKAEQSYQTITSSLPSSRSIDSQADVRNIKRVLDLVALIERQQAEQGTIKWFESPFGIETLPKHKAFFDATANYNEVCFLAANRVGKSVAGAYALSCHLTG